MRETAIALVDYDNVKLQQDKNPGDVSMNLADLVPVVVSEARKALDQPRELLLRVYGGWIDEHGLQTTRAQWLLVGLSCFRGRTGPTIVKPMLVTALACRSTDTVVGTVRQTSSGLRQKMVDNMIALDALYFARDHRLPVLLFSDDDDLVPTAIVAGTIVDSVRFHWLRRRNVGSGINDALIRRAGITFGSTP